MPTPRELPTGFVATELRALVNEAGAAGSLSLNGVTIHLDQIEGEHYIETAPGFEVRTLRQVERLARVLNFEPIPLAECEPVEFPDGRVRHYLVDVEPKATKLRVVA